MQTNSLIAELAESCVQAFSKSSGIGCEFCSQKGEVIASDGFCCSICNICSEVGISKDDCVRLHAFTAKASEREDGKYMYECPLGFSCITSAVLSDSIPGARLTLGPFLMEDRQDFAEYDLTQLMKLEPEAVESVKAKLGSVPVVEPQAVNAFSQLLVYSAAFLSSSSGNGDYLSDLESGSIKAWEKENRIDPSETVAKVTGYMEENFSKDISLMEIARHAGMTTTYLCRLFKK